MLVVDLHPVLATVAQVQYGDHFAYTVADPPPSRFMVITNVGVMLPVDAS